MSVRMIFISEDLIHDQTRNLQPTIDVISRKNVFLYVNYNNRGLGGDIVGVIVSLYRQSRSRDRI